MADKAKKKAVIYLFLCGVGLILLILYAQALFQCPYELMLSYALLTAICALQVIFGLWYTVLTLKNRESGRLGGAIAAIFAVTSIPVAIMAALWALRLAFLS